MSNLTSRGQPYHQATTTLLAIAKCSSATSQGRKWTRDELYERDFTNAKTGNHLPCADKPEQLLYDEQQEAITQWLN